MPRFLSSATNRIDAKGRVSIPAAFRTVLASLGIEELYCFQDFHFPAINIGGPDLLARFERQLDGHGTAARVHQRVGEEFRRHHFHVKE